MTIVCGVFLCMLLALIGIRTEKKLFNPVTVFCGLWCVIIFLSSLQLYRLYLAEAKTYRYILFGICMYFIGYYFIKLILKNKKIVVRKYYNMPKQKHYELRYKAIYIMLIFSILFFIKDLASIISKIGMNHNLSVIQNLIQGDDDVFVRSSIENALILLFVNPFTWICAPITIIDFWMGKRDKKLLIMTIMLVVLKTLTTGGRAMFIQLAFYFVCVFTLINSKRSTKFSQQVRATVKKNKKIFIISGIICICILYILTYSRAGQAAIKTIYYDFAMQPYMFQIWCKVADTTDIGFGVASLNGFLFPINYILRNTIQISLPQSYHTIYELIESTDTQWQWIGNGVSANAYTSAFWFFYVDGRIMGIAIISFIYGIYSRIIFKNMETNPTQRNMAIYCMVIIGVFYTFGRFQFAQYNYALGIIYLGLFAYKKTNINLKGIRT